MCKKEKHNERLVNPYGSYKLLVLSANYFGV